MANTKSAAKRARQTAKRLLRNRSVLTRLRRMGKGSTGSNVTPDSAHALISVSDKAAKRGVIHKNAANRRKARLHKALASAKAGA